LLFSVRGFAAIQAKDELIHALSSFAILLPESVLREES